MTFHFRAFVQMTSYVADSNRTGFDQWAKKNNLKEAAKTFSYLSQHNLLNYEEFQNHVADLEASIHATDDKIQQTKQALQNQQVIQKQQKPLHVIENNFDAMIREAGIRIPEKAPALPHQPDRSEPLS